MKLDRAGVNALLSMSDDGLSRAVSVIGAAFGVKLTREVNAARLRAVLGELTDGDLARISELINLSV